MTTYGHDLLDRLEFDIVKYAEDKLVDPIALAHYLEDNHLTTEAEADEYLHHFEDAYVGWFEGGLVGFAEAWLDDTDLVSEWARPYIDLDKIVRDLKCEGYYAEGVYVFRPA